MRLLREVLGLVVLILALGVLAGGIWELRAHDYVSAIVLVVVGLGLLGAGLELVRPSMAE